MKFFSYTKFAFAFFFFSFPFVLACSPSESGDHGFNYDEGTLRGPSRWGTLKQKWENCSAGREQSPIDIGTVQVSSQLGDLQRNYRSAQAVLRNRTEDVAVVFQGDAGSININGTVYKAVNCHWHSPSEHTFNGTRYPLEIHIVHRSDRNETAVVGILYRYGLPDPFIASILLPILSLGREDIPLGLVNPEAIGFPGSSYYRYNGSLTTPPCSENVTWTVFKEIKMVTPVGVEALRRVLPPQNRNNSRPTQPLNDRTVLFHPRRSFT
ncbi:A. THALIANA ALPHA CARBONIC ANHYDRASE 4, alpha carbonic anhydrase 4 [Hibiscus trionum]|uniref:A. THALIANA ALPHA CARBONIC ANHYDRASE 4, alpha carbonic anhydrase 4 n=1 Tax=Hibiscus trionum TaxID=183268 RepID=A0A9W7JLK5_HIBTR|nr:A. THALIANA ALPHA CARBONIC ANHYDRASE 4, alpha carbonic anhydrase 4 [Hibiscus trionum]